MYTMRPLILIIILMSVVQAGCAQDRSLPEGEVITVEEVLTTVRDDAHVTVEGKLIQYLGDEEYMLDDATGQVIVDIDDDLLEPRRYEEGMSVRLYGEVEKDRDSREPVEIDVERILIL